VVKIVEVNRKGTSCPVLLTWDGERFRFVSDFLGPVRWANWGRRLGASTAAGGMVKIEPDR
jgi:hypothetical protein